MLHQYNVMVRGLAVCMDFKSVFYIDLTEPPKHNKQSSTVEQRLQDIRNVLENHSSVKVCDSNFLEDFVSVELHMGLNEG